MIITISGTAGSGKTSVAKALAKRLGWEYLSIGSIRRKIAEELGIDINEFNKLSEKNPKYDKMVDDFQRKLKDHDKLIVDSRLGFYFIPNSFKVFIKVDPKIAAKRIFMAKREDERYNSIEEAYKKIIKRDQSDIKRYTALYGINHLDESNYDLVIDSSDKTINEIVDIIVNFLKTKGLLKV